jgi:hypothetical protein
MFVVGEKINPVDIFKYNFLILNVLLTYKELQSLTICGGDDNLCTMFIQGMQKTSTMTVTNLIHSMLRSAAKSLTFLLHFHHKFSSQDVVND